MLSLITQKLLENNHMKTRPNRALDKKQKIVSVFESFTLEVIPQFYIAHLRNTDCIIDNILK
jgi:hypothetical protein